MMVRLRAHNDIVRAEYSQKAAAIILIAPIRKRNVFSERTMNWNQIQFSKWLMVIIIRHKLPQNNSAPLTELI